MEKISLETLNLKELLSLEESVKKIIAQRRDAQRALVRQQVEEFIEGMGFSVDDLFVKSWVTANPRNIDQRRFVAPKYRNPEDSSETWTGRGRKPKWVEKALKKGLTLEAITISKEA